MSVIPMTPPSTSKDVKSAKRAVSMLHKDVSNIRRDIMRRKVGNVNAAKEVAARKSAQIRDLQQNMARSPVVKRSRANKYRKYRMPLRMRQKKQRRQRRRPVPLKKSIQASISARSTKLKQTKTVKPFRFTPKRLPRAPRVPARVPARKPMYRRKRRLPRRQSRRRTSQSPVRPAKKIISRPRRLSKNMIRRAKQLPPSPQRTALRREAATQNRNAMIARQQLHQNRMRMMAAKKANIKRKQLDRIKQETRFRPKRKIPMTRKNLLEMRRAMSRRKPKSRQPIKQRAHEKVSSLRRKLRVRKPRKPKVAKVNRRLNTRANRALVQVRQDQAIQEAKAKANRAQAQESMLKKSAMRRSIARQQSKAISKANTANARQDLLRQRKFHSDKIKSIEKQLAKTRAKRASVASMRNRLSRRTTSLRRKFSLGVANLGAIRRNDNLADNHRHNIQELSMMEQQLQQLGTAYKQLGSAEEMLLGQLNVAAEQFGEMNAHSLYSENKQNRSQTTGLEKCLADKLLELNQQGKVSGEGIQKAKANIRLFDKRQITFKEAKKRIYRELKAHFTPRGGDLIQRDVRSAGLMLEKLMSDAMAAGKKVTPMGEAAFHKVVREYEVGQIKTLQEFRRRALLLLNNPHVITNAISPAQLGHARALGIAATIRNRKSRQLPGIVQLTAEKRANYERLRVAEDEAAKARYNKVYQVENLAGLFPRTRSAMERLVR